MCVIFIKNAGEQDIMGKELLKSLEYRIATQLSTFFPSRIHTDSRTLAEYLSWKLKPQI